MFHLLLQLADGLGKGRGNTYSHKHIRSYILQPQQRELGERHTHTRTRTQGHKVHAPNGRGEETQGPTTHKRHAQTLT